MLAVDNAGRTNADPEFASGKSTGRTNGRERSFASDLSVGRLRTGCGAETPGFAAVHDVTITASTAAENSGRRW